MELNTETLRALQDLGCDGTLNPDSANFATGVISGMSAEHLRTLAVALLAAADYLAWEQDVRQRTYVIENLPLALATIQRLGVSVAGVTTGVQLVYAAERAARQEAAQRVGAEAWHMAGNLRAGFHLHQP